MTLYGVSYSAYTVRYGHILTCSRALLYSVFIEHKYQVLLPFLFFLGCTVASRGGYQMARGRHYAKLSLSNAARLSFSDLCILLFMFLSLCRLCVCVFLCSHWSLVDVPLIFFCPADHVPDWQPRVLLGMVEARSVNVKKTTTTTTSRCLSTPDCVSPNVMLLIQYGLYHLLQDSKTFSLARVASIRYP